MNNDEYNMFIAKILIETMMNAICRIPFVYIALAYYLKKEVYNLVMVTTRHHCNAHTT